LHLARLTFRDFAINLSRKGFLETCHWRQ
jgi:hypothetical protein